MLGKKFLLAPDSAYRKRPIANSHNCKESRCAISAMVFQLYWRPHCEIRTVLSIRISRALRVHYRALGAPKPVAPTQVNGLEQGVFFPTPCGCHRPGPRPVQCPGQPPVNEFSLPGAPLFRIFPLRTFLF